MCVRIRLNYAFLDPRTWIYQQLFLTSIAKLSLGYKVSSSNHILEHCHSRRVGTLRKRSGNFEWRWKTRTWNVNISMSIRTRKHHLITIVYRRFGLSDRTTRCGFIPLKCIIGLEPSFQQRLTRIPTLYRGYTFQNLRPRNVHGKVQASGRKKETAPTVTRSHFRIRRVRGEGWTCSIVRERPKQTLRVSSYSHQGLDHQL